MNTRRNLAALIGAGAMAVAIGAGGAGAAVAAPVPAAPAAAAAAAHGAAVKPHTGGWASLSISSLGGSMYSVTIYGQAYLSSVVSRNISFSLYGDDTFFDTNLFDKNFLTTYSDGSFYVNLTLPGYTLDEDWGRDEVYAKAHVYEPGVGTFNLTTNTVTGYF